MRALLERTQLKLGCRLAEPSPGPRTPEGNVRAARNGNVRQTGDVSTRAIARELAELHRLMRDMARAGAAFQFVQRRRQHDEIK
jgi:hypothetical protein